MERVKTQEKKGKEEIKGRERKKERKRKERKKERRKGGRKGKQRKEGRKLDDLAMSLTRVPERVIYSIWVSVYFVCFFLKMGRWS